MTIKILTPEAVIFEGDIDSVLVPGINGEFHIMKNHAPIVSSLGNGSIKIFASKIENAFAKNFKTEGEKEFLYPIKTGVIEFSNDKGIILCEA